MTPLVDGDIFLHEISWSGQFKDKDTGEEVILGFDKLVDMLDEKVRIIEEETGATKPLSSSLPPPPN